jgi:hypothetical protein
LETEASKANKNYKRDTKETFIHALWPGGLQKKFFKKLK